MKKHFLTILFLTFFIEFFSLKTAFALINSADSLVLIQLYNGTNGASWANPWNLSKSSLTWSGLQLNEAGRVIGLNLAGRNMTGRIPAQIYLLPFLKTLSLSGNTSLDPNLDVIRQMTQLENLYLNNIRLGTSGFPNMGSLSNLQILDISNNSLTEFPSWLFVLGNLRELYIGSNKILGNIPTGMGGLINLKILHIYNNNLSGDFPISMINLAQLREFRGENNKLKSGLSQIMRNWLNLETIILNNNQIIDTLTYRIGEMANLQTIQISNNKFFGEFPEQMSRLRKLTFFDASNNIFLGRIPQEIGEIVSLRHLNLSFNRLDLGIPYSFSNLINLNYFNCANNELGGSLPSDMGNLKELTYLNIANNEFNGDFPATVRGMNKLTYFNMSNNGFYYDNLQQITTLTSLQFLDISQNLIARKLPNDLGKLVNLTYFNCSNNLIPDKLPTTIGNLKKLQYFLANNNRITGSIPLSINGATSLIEFNVANNKIVDLPVFDSLKVNILNVQNNYLTFEDIEPNLYIARNFYYSPQAIVPIEQPCLLKVNVGGKYNNYQWFYNGTDVSCDCDKKEHTYLATKSGSYYCLITNDSVKNLTIRSEIASISQYLAPEVDLGKDTVFCELPISLKLDAGKGANSYLWSMGDTTRFAEITKPGVYFVQVKKTICTVIDTIRVFYAGAIDNIISENQIICKGEAPKTIKGNASSAWHKYVWQTSDNLNVWKNVGTELNYTPPKDNRQTAYFRRLVVSDTCGAQESNIVSIKVSDITLKNTLISHISCAGEKDGEVNLIITGGVRPIRIYSNIFGDSTITHFKGLSAGMYNFKITDGAGCQILQEVEIKEPLPLAISATIVPATCKTPENDGIIAINVTGGTPPYRFNWNNGEFNSQNLNGLPPSEEKKYALTVTDFRGCQIAYEAKMYRRAVLAVEVSYHDNTFCTTENNPLPTTNDAGGKFYCLEKGLNVDETTGELNLAIATEGIYQIVYELDVCSQDTFQITIDGRCLENLPNTITPNADGVNDVWQSPIFDRYPNMTVRFFDRTGLVIFESDKGYSQKWDGTFQGNPLPEDTYYYVIEFNDPKLPLNHHNGFVSLIRR